MIPGWEIILLQQQWVCNTWKTLEKTEGYIYIYLSTVGDLLIFNKGDGPMWASPCPDTPIYTLLTITMTFLILEFHFIQLSSFSTYYNCLFITELKYWVRIPLNCMQWTEFIQTGFSHVSHTWNFLPSKFLDGHSINIKSIYQILSQIYRNQRIYCPIWRPYIKKNYKYRTEKVTPAGCVSTGDKRARKCNSHLTNG